MIEITENTYSDGFFGNVDASRVNLADFISINGVLIEPHSNPSAMQDRIIVGRKGSGKTLYIRKLQDEARGRDLLTYGEVDYLYTDTIIHFLKRIREYVYTIDRTGDFDVFLDRRKTIISVWRNLWDKAISISVLSLALEHLRGRSRFETTNPVLRRFNNLEQMEDFLINQYQDLFLLPNQAISPVSCLKSTYEHLESSRRLQKFLNHAKWPEFQSFLKGMVTECPPIAIYIDQLDDEFDHAPEAWLICQLGLYRSILQSAFSQSSYSGRVHVVAALRDAVYAAALRDEHASRQFQNSYIKTLDWSPKGIRSFFAEKLTRGLSKSPDAAQSELPALIERWLGYRTVVNGRGMAEDVATYILRHSRMLPRDIVMLGNAIGAEIHRRRSLSQVFHEGSLRKCVSVVAEVIGNESIALCINEALSSMDGFAYYVRDLRGKAIQLTDYRKYIEDKVANFFLLAGEEIVTTTTVQQALIASELATEEEFIDGAESYYRFYNILWRHGLIAYREIQGLSKKWRFNWSGAVNANILPYRATEIGFHASVIDVFKIKPSSDGPVV